METINRVIADLLKKRGGTDAEVAEKLGTSPQAIGLYKNGKRSPGSDFIIAWRKEFGDDIVAICLQYETGVYPGTGQPETDTETLLRELKDIHSKNVALKDQIITMQQDKISKLEMDLDACIKRGAKASK